MSEAEAPEPLLWLTEQDVVSLVDLKDSIEALQLALAAEHRSQAFSIRKALGTWEPRSSAHALGAVSAESGMACFKTWVNTPSGAAALLTLFDSRRGRLLAAIEAGGIGAMRTAAISGVATHWLTDASARSMAVIGTGRQALQQVAAVAVVRDLEDVRVYSPTPEHRVAFAARVRSELGLHATVAGSVSEAVDGQPIVTLVTRATEPFLAASDLAPGAHVNAVGAILPANAELLPGVLEQASLVVVDNVENARAASRELREHLGERSEAWEAVVPLHAVVGGSVTRPSEGLTIFKGMGMGLSDLAVAVLVHQRAVAAGVGLPLPHPVPAAPRWTAREQHRDGA